MGQQLTEVVDDDVDVRLVCVQGTDLKQRVKRGRVVAAAGGATMFPMHVKYKALEAVTMVKADPALRRMTNAP